MRPLLIGMNNPLSMEPEYALYPAPEGCTGYRLWQMLDQAVVNGVLRATYIKVFERTNLVVGPWSARLARVNAGEMMRRGLGADRPVLLLGSDVWRAFRLPADVLPCESTQPYPRGPVLWRVPHPSGRNLWYNDPDNRRRVGQLLARLAGMEVR